jgi:Xaa-Pro aminopeptidase
MQSKIDQAIKLLKDHNIECWIMLVREGREKAVQLLLETEFIGESAFILTPERKIAVVAGYDKDRVKGMEVLTYKKGMSEILPHILQEISPNKIHLNFSEYDHTADSLTYGLFLKFQKILKNWFSGDILSAESFLEQLRSQKTPEEIHRIKTAVDITEDIFEELPVYITEGVTEHHVMETMVHLTREKGCELAWDEPAVTFGLETELGHRISSDRKLKKNESIHIDFGVRYKGYCSDIQRVFFYGGNPPEGMVTAFNTIRAAQDESIKKITPGKKGHEIDAVAREIISENYPEYNHGLGHQIGQLVHDGGCILGPLWERYKPNAEKVIRKGNVFTVEPTISGKVNLGLEDDIVVQERAELLSHPQKDVIVI